MAATGAGGPSVTVVDYGLANIRSVVNAFEYLGARIELAETGDALAEAERVVLPGVGSFDAGMRGLRERGHVEMLERRVREQGAPFLGVCLGMQFLLEGSEEGSEPGLGWLPGTCRRFPEGDGAPPVPHIGWNEIDIRRGEGLFAGVEPASDVYFVHSYYAPLDDGSRPVAAGLCHYGVEFVAALESGNLWACQFHPEKSQMTGLKMLQNFLETAPA